MTTGNYAGSSAAATPGGEVDTSSPAQRAPEQVKEQSRQVAGTAAEQGRQVAGTAADEARHVAGVAQGEAQRVASEAVTQVRGLLDEATAQVAEQSRTQLGRLTETLRSLGEDLERMASEGEGPASGLAQEAGERTRALASRLDGREPADLLEDVRGFARRRPGAFLLGALAAGVVAGRLTRGAKAAQDGSGSDASARRSNIGYDAGLPASPYDSPRTADLASSGEPWSTGAATPSSGPVYDTSTQGHGTATGEPLAGTGTPASRPVYPGGAEDGRA
jgi:hypothetical protein